MTKVNDVMEALKLIDEIDIQMGLKNCMDEEFYEEILGDYLEGDKTEKVEQYYQEEDWKNYEIQVHGLKSTSLTIGAISLSEKAKALEKAAGDGDMDYIKLNHALLMAQYKRLLNQLREIL